MNVIGILPVCITWILVSAGDHIPEGHNLTVHVHCGNETVGGSVEVISDLVISATATCSAEYRDTLTQLDNATHPTHIISVVYSGDNTRACVFSKREDVYSIEIVVEWREYPAAPPNKEIYHVRCIYNGSTSIGQVSHPVLKNVIYPRVIEVYQGKLSKRNFSLLLVDVLNQNLVGVNIRTGKTVQLKAFVGPDTSMMDQGAGAGPFNIRSVGRDERTIYPVSCDAVGATHGTRYTILRAGCGDGIVFHQDAGFSIKRNVAESPYFKYFHIDGDDQMKFECNFTVCENCENENSCSNKPKSSLNLDKLWNEFVQWLAKTKISILGKRSVPDLEPSICVKSNVIKIEQTRYYSDNGSTFPINDVDIQPSSPAQNHRHESDVDNTNGQVTGAGQETSGLKTVISWPQKVVICTMGIIIGAVMFVIVICVCHDQHMCSARAENVRITNGAI
ncbi:vitelline envelope sperm lysin receptor-like [Gigantopelta aegis]|uniref:vitelline envelope sperm lysin receptor-like n=1 Tax=Gigantopelta aegis TaxID=1735272 RepID=UPI001B88BAE7|nr:vitelline envelope sperm lysin receptor-like [Gigantopelta aegis]